jgi:hypothetical protein
MTISSLPIYNFYHSEKINDYSQLFNIDQIQKYVNYSVYKFFNQSLAQDEVITGENNFLFLGNKYTSVLHKTNGIFKRSPEEIELWANKLKNRQDWYSEKGIKFVYVIIPNKHTVYRENLPNWMSYTGRTLTDDLVDSAIEKNINVLDLRKTLIDNKKDGKLLYFKSDSHWSNLSASISYNSTISYINQKYNENIKKINYSIVDHYRSGGDLSFFLKFISLLGNKYENSYNFIFKHSDIKLFKINKETAQISPNYTEKQNQNIFINKDAFMISNEYALNDIKLLFLCDSYSAITKNGKTGNSVLYNETFKIVWQWHYDQLRGKKLSDFIEENKPDIIIQQVIERTL